MYRFCKDTIVMPIRPFLCSCDSFSLDQFEEAPAQHRVSPFQILNHLTSLLHAAVIPAADNRAPVRCAETRLRSASCVKSWAVLWLETRI